MPNVLSHFQARTALDAQKAGIPTTPFTWDLGATTTVAALTDTGLADPDGNELRWGLVEEIADDTQSCYLMDQDAEGVWIEKIQRFSETLNRVYTLYPTPGPPTMLISGIPMHRIKETDPGRDTAAKIKAAGPFHGPVLDTATGLGYTATATAAKGVPVTTIELDPTVLEICRLNPWSAALFDNPHITQRLGDAGEVVTTLPDAAFAHVVHDPPMFSLAGHLYGAEFYAHLFRILRPKGKLFHYIGNPDSPSGKITTAGAIRRLHDTGFTRIARAPGAFGVIAFKP